MTSKLEKIRNINIVNFCRENNIELNQDSKEYYRLTEHDSCVINDNKNVFIWNSKGKGGNIISFVQMYYNCDFKEAIKKLSDREYELFNNTQVVKQKDYCYDNSKERPVVEARSYLIEERSNNPNIVSYFIKKGLIRQDDKKNVLFVWKDSNDKIIGCSEQGTRTFYNQKKINIKYGKKYKTKEIMALTADYL